MHRGERSGYFCPSCDDIRHWCVRCHLPFCGTCVGPSGCTTCRADLCLQCKGLNEDTCQACAKVICRVCEPMIMGCDLDQDDACYYRVCCSCAPSALTRCPHCNLWACQACKSVVEGVECDTCGRLTGGCVSDECVRQFTCGTCEADVCSACAARCSCCDLPICPDCRPKGYDAQAQGDIEPTDLKRMARACSWCKQLWCSDCARDFKECSTCTQQACKRCDFDCTLHASSSCACRSMPKATRCGTGPCRRMTECRLCMSDPQSYEVAQERFGVTGSETILTLRRMGAFLHCAECVCDAAERKRASTGARQFKLKWVGSFSIERGHHGKLTAEPPDPTGP